jgi:hypothetical protein
MTAWFVGLAGHKAEINMAPMIDVLLVLIIIFMIITPLTSTGLRTLVPQAPLPDKEQAIRFNAFESRACGYNWPTGPASTARLDPEVIDIANGAGLRRVALMTR